MNINNDVFVQFCFQNNDLAELHGASAFMDFINKKNSRRPEFLDKVSEIQEEKAMEAQIKLEAEMARQRKIKDGGGAAEMKAADKK